MIIILYRIKPSIYQTQLTDFIGLKSFIEKAIDDITKFVYDIESEIVLKYPKKTIFYYLFQIRYELGD